MQHREPFHDLLHIKSIVSSRLISSADDLPAQDHRIATFSSSPFPTALSKLYEPGPFPRPTGLLATYLPPTFTYHDPTLTTLKFHPPHTKNTTIKTDVMMKAAIPTAIALAASLASAQDFNTSAPFTLTLSSDDADIDGQLLGACHAGAAIEELCLSGTNDTATSYNTFTHNTTDTSGGASGESYPVGPLVWILPGSSFSESEGLAFNPLLESNVVAPEFFPGPSSDYVGFDDDDQLFLYSLYYDESTFEPGVFPTQITPVPLYQVS